MLPRVRQQHDDNSVLRLVKALYWPKETAQKVNPQYSHPWKWDGGGVHCVKSIIGYLSEKILELTLDRKDVISGAWGFEGPLGYYIKDWVNVRQEAASKAGALKIR